MVYILLRYVKSIQRAAICSLVLRFGCGIGTFSGAWCCMDFLKLFDLSGMNERFV